jgi:uncharacterized protein (DUF1684 family)
MTSRLLTLALLTASLHAEAPYPQQIAKFHAEREQEIKRDWLPLYGLFWLKEGDNAVGSNPRSEVVLPSSAPANVGAFTLRQGKVTFHPAAPGVMKLKNGQQITAAEVKDEVFASGTAEFFLIRRGERVAVRVKDYASPVLRRFTHLQWFGVDPSWRITAKFTAWDKPHKLSYDTVIPGLREDYESPGYVTFRKDGMDYKLEPVEEDGQLFYVFRDATSGKTTYPAARYLYSDPPRDGVVVLDFNTATNPPCAYTSFATCPLPPPQNRLKLAITAGELMHK